MSHAVHRTRLFTTFGSFLDWMHINKGQNILPNVDALEIMTIWEPLVFPPPSQQPLDCWIGVVAPPGLTFPKFWNLCRFTMTCMTCMTCRTATFLQPHASQRLELLLNATAVGHKVRRSPSNDGAIPLQRGKGLSCRITIDSSQRISREGRLPKFGEINRYLNSWQIQSGKPSCTIETFFSATWITWGYQDAARSHILNPLKNWPGLMFMKALLPSLYECNVESE